MLKTLAYSLSLALLSGAAACSGGGGDDTMDPDDGDDGDDGDVTPDTTAPTLLSTSPVHGAVGQRDDVTVSFIFSEPMDQESVENTLDAGDLGEVSLDWNDAGNMLTVTPEEPLLYAQGAGSEPALVDAATYTVILGSGAVDLAGNAMGPGVQITFDTLKQMTTALELDQALTRTISPSEILFDLNDPLVIGDDPDDGGMRSVMTFDLADLPDTTVETLSATIATAQQVDDVFGDPFVELADSITLDHVSYNSLVSESAINAAFNSSQVAYATASDFCIEAQASITMDVTAMVAEDIADRVFRQDRSQFLLRFAVATNLDGATDATVISRDETELEVVYLAP